MAAKKQTTIRVDSWLAEALVDIGSELSAGYRIGKPTMSIIISRLIAEYKRKKFEDLIDRDNLPDGMAISNGFAEVGDTVMAISGKSDVYTVSDIVGTGIERGMILLPSDKWTDRPIPSRTVFYDYAILKKGSKDA